MKKDIFKEELSRFTNENVRKSAEYVLEQLPDYFYTVPASSTGKYHPSFSLGEGGLVRHVKAAMIILEEMFQNEVFCSCDEYKKDLIRMALLLHDGFKHGLVGTGYTVVEHPVIMADYLVENKDKLFISEDDAKFVASLIRCHMGPWNKDRFGKVIMPVPKTEEEKLVHLCDYIASRKCIEIKVK